jgi:NTE family protein
MRTAMRRARRDRRVARFACALTAELSPQSRLIAIGARRRLPFKSSAPARANAWPARKSMTSRLLSERRSCTRKPVGLALQGGGSFGAYTWGALDALLASRSISIAQLSGTSAGAINAAIVASSLAKGSSAKARAALRDFWLAIAVPAVAELVAVPPAAQLRTEVWGPVERKWRETVGGWLLSANALSPYQVNPLGINPLRKAIAAHVDIDAIRGASAPALFVTLTNVRTGLPRIVTNAAMSIDVLLASAALPQLFQAVEIDGEPYWDGGYLGNPTLWPMIESGLARDLIVVQLAPDEAPGVPTDTGGIRRRLGEIVFNSSLVAEMHAISAMRAVAGRGGGVCDVRDLRLHRIGPPRHDVLREGSSLERSRAWLERLQAEGRRAGRRFLARHARDIGVRETLDVAKVFGHPRAAAPQTAANDDIGAPRVAPSAMAARPRCA